MHQAHLNVVGLTHNQETMLLQNSKCLIDDKLLHIGPARIG